MDSNKFKCYIGKCLDDCCKYDSHTKSEEIYDFQELSEEDQLLLECRVPNISVKNICSYHKSRYLKYYSSYQTSCCDPYNKHEKKRTNNLKSITLQLHLDYKQVTKQNIVPGKKVCGTCYNELLIITKPVRDERDATHSVSLITLKPSESESDTPISSATDTGSEFLPETKIKNNALVI